jgi:GNAT superfamily N-acetyltransferase
MTTTTIEPVQLADVVIRPPEGLEKRACRMLLPEVVREGFWSDFVLAVTGSPLRILGAAAFTPALSPDGTRCWRVSLRVARPYRRQGVGTALLRHLTAAAQVRHVGSLFLNHDPQAEPDVAPFLAACGFTFADRLTTFETDTERLTAYLLPLRDWLIERGEIPADARLIPLRDAPLEKVAELHAKYIGGTPGGVLAHLRRALRLPTADDHIVLMIGDKVEGMLLGETIDGLTRIDSRIVTAAYQGSPTNPGWANVLLMAERLEWAVKRGSRRCRFSCISTNRPTLKLAARSGAATVSVAEIQKLTLPPS